MVPGPTSIYDCIALFFIDIFTAQMLVCYQACYQACYQNYSCVNIQCKQQPPSTELEHTDYFTEEKRVTTATSIKPYTPCQLN